MAGKGLVMDKYISFKSNIDNILSSFGGKVSEKISVGSDITEIRAK